LLLQPEFIRTDKRGRLIQLTSGLWEQINILEIKKGKSMGGHYHKETHEFFYVISGHVNVFIYRKGDKDNREFEAKAGECFTIGVDEYHYIEGLKASKLVVILSKKYNAQNPDIHTGGLDAM